MKLSFKCLALVCLAGLYNFCYAADDDVMRKQANLSHQQRAYSYIQYKDYAESQKKKTPTKPESPTLKPIFQSSKKQAPSLLQFDSKLKIDSMASKSDFTIDRYKDKAQAKSSKTTKKPSRTKTRANQSNKKNPKR
ncbi:MAG: hypothetical protein WCT20_04755 [Candidatus Babeliales bacterium]